MEVPQTALLLKDALALSLQRLPVRPAVIVLVPTLLLDLLLPLAVPTLDTTIIPVARLRAAQSILVLAVLPNLLALPLSLVLAVTPIGIVVPLSVIPISVDLILPILLFDRTLALSFVLTGTLFRMALLDLGLPLLSRLTLLLLPRLIASLHLFTTLLAKIAIILPLLRLCGDRRRWCTSLFGLLGLPLLAPFGTLLLTLFAALLTLLLNFLAALVPTLLRLGVGV